MEQYFSGKKLFGDDFNDEQIALWYLEESEGYADLGSKDRTSYSYEYHNLNQLYGFSKIKDRKFDNVLGFGSAWGDEFFPIISNIKNITIIEPSENLQSEKIGRVIPLYVKPEISGKINFENERYDLITCFGTLHHIPNVSFVLSELFRILKKGGILLIREPIISMGDWRIKRSGLTKNERGIPVCFFDNLFEQNEIETVSKNYCFTLTSLLQRKFGNKLNRPLHTYKAYLLFDKIISNLLKFNVHYHSLKRSHRLSPQNIYYVLRKR